MEVVVVTTTPTEHDKFRGDMVERLDKFGFRPQLPETTRRSGGLDPQSAIIVGFLPDPMHRVLAVSNSLPGYRQTNVFAYTGANVHCTIGVRQVTKGIDTIVNPDQLMGEVDRLAEALRPLAWDMSPLPCGPIRVMANSDSIIGVVPPSDELLTDRQAVIDTAAQIGLELQPSWGTHLTLARFGNELTPEQRALVNEAMTSTHLIPSAQFRTLLVGVLQVSGGRFNLIKRIELPMMRSTTDNAEIPCE